MRTVLPSATLDAPAGRPPQRDPPTWLSAPRAARTYELVTFTEVSDGRRASRCRRCGGVAGGQVGEHGVVVVHLDVAVAVDLAVAAAGGAFVVARPLHGHDDGERQRRDL